MNKFQWVDDLKRAVDEVDMKAIIARQRERLRSGLEPTFTIHLDRPVYPALWSWMVENDAWSVCGCPVAWHESVED